MSMTTGTSSTLATSDLAVDHELADIAAGFDFLLDVTPVNGVAAREAFIAGDADAPPFVYRESREELAVARRRLQTVDVASVQDELVAHLLQAKVRELDLQLEMLSVRNRDPFPLLGVELYGPVDAVLLEHAEHILATVTASTTERSGERWLAAEAFAERAEAELEHYRVQDPDLALFVEIRDDCTEVMVVNGVLLVPASISVPEWRAEALVQHEIGTHALTYANGAAQPLRLLAAGLAGYEGTQEGLALVAEYLCGGFTARRLRQIAARVVAVHRMLDGATFRSVYEWLLATDIPPGAAFATTMRAFRGGGLAKDAIYLRGLCDLLGHLGGGGTLDMLWTGKMPLTSLPTIRALTEQGALAPARIVPRYLTRRASAERLRNLATPTLPVDLIED
jgi:uncharacterized protein (TIGR02421 family)